MLSQADEVLRVEDHGDKKRQADRIVEIAMREPTADVVGFENVTVDRVENQRGDAHGIGEIAESRRRIVVFSVHWRPPIENTR